MERTYRDLLVSFVRILPPTKEIAPGCPGPDTKFFYSPDDGSLLGHSLASKGQIPFVSAGFVSELYRQSDSVCIDNPARGETPVFSLTADDVEARFSRGYKADETPERAFDRLWVEALLQRTKGRLAEDYRQANRQALFDLLEPHLMCDENALSRLEIGKQLNMSQPAIAMSIHRMRRRYGDILLNEVSRTVDDPADAEDELRRLMAIVRGE